MKRAILAVASTVAGLVLVLSYRPDPLPAKSPPIVVAPAAGGPRGDPANSAKKGLTPTGEHHAGSGVDLTGHPDGSYISEPVEIAGGHGLLQVTLTITGGRVVGLEFAHEPTSGHSQMISGSALPLLTEALLDTQQAPVDTVSGATMVSHAFNDAVASAVGR